MPETDNERLLAHLFVLKNGARFYAGTGGPRIKQVAFTEAWEDALLFPTHYLAEDTRCLLKLLGFTCTVTPAAKGGAG